MTPKAPGSYHRSELYSTENTYHSGKSHECPKVGERSPAGGREGQRDSRNSEASPTIEVIFLNKARSSVMFLGLRRKRMWVLPTVYFCCNLRGNQSLCCLEKSGEGLGGVKGGKHNQNILHELFLINHFKKVYLCGQNREKNTVKPRTKMSPLICLTIWEGAQTEDS